MRLARWLPGFPRRERLALGAGTALDRLLRAARVRYLIGDFGAAVDQLHGHIAQVIRRYSAE